MSSVDAVWPRASIGRVVVENYRSIRHCDVSLGPLTVLVGPNAAGKSNFMDSIHFVSDALNLSLPEAVRLRGGLRHVIFHETGTGKSLSMAISLKIRRPAEGETPAAEAQYSITVGQNSTGKLAVVGERFAGSGGWQDQGFTRTSSDGVYPGQLGDDAAVTREFAEPQHLYLPEYRNRSLHSGGGTAPSEVLDFLRSAAFYDLDTATLRAVDDSEPSTRPDVLGPRGEHLGHVIGLMAEHAPDDKETLDAYVSVMVPNALGLDQRAELGGSVSAVEGRFTNGSAEGATALVQRWALSEGTLRLGGILAALFQPAVFAGSVPFVGIEEPEKALHPPKLGVLFEILDAASHATQVMVTTQGPDLFDNKAAKPKHILVVENIDGETVIGPLDDVGLSLYEDKVLNLTDLMRYGSMHPALPESSDEVEE